MAPQFQHVKSGMQRCISESEARMELRMEHMMDLKVQAVNQCLDAFKLRVLERPVPTTDVSSLRKELDSLRADLDKILVPPIDEPESTHFIPADDTVLDALFGEDLPQPESTRARGKRPRSSRTSVATEDAQIKKHERQQTDHARRASIVDEELRQQRVREVTLRDSSSRPTTEAVATVRDDMSTIDGM